MADEETTKERQENELEALRAIYGEDIIDTRKKQAWNLWKPLDVIISLSPLKGSSTPKEIYVSVNLHVICSEEYPNVAPKLLLENSKGMSNIVLNKLQIDLEEKAKSYIGEVMIFQLAQYVQSFLHEHNKPGSKSFYEEMLKRKQEKEKQERLARQKEKETEMEGILHEYTMKQVTLKLENKRKKERYNSADSNYIEDNYEGGKRDVSIISPCQCKGTEVIEFSNNYFQEVQKGKCISHLLNNNSILYSALDLETGEFYGIMEWSIPYPKEDIQILRQITSIEQECSYLIKLKHPNILRYHNIKHNIDLDRKIINVYVLQELNFGLNCISLYFNQNLTADLDVIRNIASGVLNGLEFLHRNSVVHKDVSLSNIYHCKEGTVKLANHSLSKRLSDLTEKTQASNYFSKKNDIFKFGLVVLSLFKKEIVSEDNVSISTSVFTDFHDFLTKCLAKDEKERFTATQLLNHVFIRTPIEKPLSHEEDDIPLVTETHSQQMPSDLKLFNSSISSGPSRVETEFEVLKYIGKGAFGDVIKVRNKLDGGYYALKRIELNPKSKQLNKKITREVKLLSKLNHENVVRYYNAWIETAVLKDENDRSRSSSEGTIFKGPKVVKPKELTLENDIELLAPPIKNVEWSISYGSKSHPNTVESSSSSEEDSSEEFNWGIRLEVDSDSESIKFEYSKSYDKNGENSTDDTKAIDQVNADNVQRIREIQFLYIQMEFCEKSTLRNAIDNDLYTDMNRVWRLFREIVEGLAHIHQQGMIHRDLKPVNIFLDSNDHVKIGDFGLATTNLFSRQDIVGSKSLNDNVASLEDSSLTGQVGTALYTAPELNTTSKAVYDQKVDIYSLGIIFFEMCYRPLSIQMERIKILNNLRTAEIVLPVDFKGKMRKKQESIIKWLLNHDVSKRPTSQELLQSDVIPAPVLEEEKLRDMFRHTLRNPQLKSYKFLIASCFEQPVTKAHDLTYDLELSGSYSTKSLLIYDLVKETVVKIFKLHGGRNITTPLLIPKSKYYDNLETCVKLMTHAGSIVSLPHDLRVPFARYVVWNEIKHLRRYSIDRVYREKKVFGLHPRELFECAFDIVSPTPDNFMSDSEIIHIVCEILEELPGMKNKSFVIRINHTKLLKAILLHCGIKDDHENIYKILSEAKESKSKNLQIKNHLLSIGLSDNSITTLFNLIELEQPFSKIISILQIITKKKSTEAAQLAKQALQELKTIIHNAENLGVTHNIVVMPGLVYNIQQYSGMFCQFLGEFKKRKRHVYEVIAAGGRYDEMIKNYRYLWEQAWDHLHNIDTTHYAVGISISLDKLVQAVQEELEKDVEMNFLDVVICSLGLKNFVHEKAQIVKDLWSAGIRASIVEALDIEELQEICVELNVTNVILFKEKGTARLQSWEKGKFQEKAIPIADVVDTLIRSIKNVNESSFEQQLTSILRSESKVSNSDHFHDTFVSVDFITNEKLSSNARKRYENQIRSQLDSTFKRFNGEVVVLATTLETNLIKSLSSYLEFDCETSFQKTVNSIIEKSQRHRTYLVEVCDEVYEYKTKNLNTTIILYSLSDQFHRVIF